MILQVLADAFQVDGSRYAVFGKVLAIADTRQHQQLRRIDHAAGDDYFALGTGDGCAVAAG